MKLKDRIQHAWNAFNSKDPVGETAWTYGAGSGSPSHKTYRRYGSSSFSSAIFNRIAIDVSMTSIQHVKIDAKTDNWTPVKSGLQDCLTIEANIDQTGFQFLQDVVYSMFDEGSVAVVPVDTTTSPSITGSYEVNSMRVGKITQWFPKHVTVRLYNEETGNYEDVTLEKSFVAIIENPLYAVINGPNATLSRLLTKMGQLDDLDAMLASGKLDMLIQLPYTIKTDLQRTQAEERIKGIESAMAKNKHGISYVDGSEKVIQLNRQLNSQLVDDISNLTKQFYNQLGLTENVFSGTASELEMRTYYTRTIDPIMQNILSEFNRKFLTKTARSQGQRLESYRDPFSLVPIEQIAQIADTFKRNELASSNEIRKIIKLKPNSSPEADLLRNPNIAGVNQTPKQGSLTSPAEAPKLPVKMSEK